MGLFSLFKFKDTESYASDFDIAFKKQGGLFSINRVDEDTYLLLSNLKSDSQNFIDTLPNRLINRPGIGRHLIPHIHFDFINNSKLNAGANSENNKEFIGINYGSVLLLLDLFNRMLSRNDILIEIGNPSEEINPEPLPFLVANHDILKDMYHTDSYASNVLPKNQQRRDHAALLTSFAIEFLILHEYIHLQNGHVKYYHEVTGSSSFFELHTSGEPFISPQIRKTLEFDADAWATAYAINEMIIYLLNDKQMEPIFSSYKSFNTGLLINWEFSIWALYSLMDYVSGRNSDFSSTSHPSSRQRQLNNYTVAQKNLDDMCKSGLLSENPLAENFIKISTEAENALRLIATDSVTAEELTQLHQLLAREEELYGSTGIYNFQKEYRTFWENELMHQIMPYSRVVLS